MRLKKLFKSLFLLIISLLVIITTVESRAQSAMFTDVFTAGDGGIEETNAIISDSGGNMYVTGSYSSTCIIGDDTLTVSGYETVFLAKCDPDSGFQWAAGPDCSDMAFGDAIAFDNTGALYLAGSFRGQLNFGSGIVLNAIYYKTFIAKYDTNGNISWARTFSGDDGNSPRAMAGDNEGNIYLNGLFQYDLLYDEFSLYSLDYACYVLKIDGTGDAEWLVQSEGSGDTYPQSLVIDPEGDIVMTGNFYGEIIFGSHTLDGVHPGYSISDIFICKLRADGYFEWAVEAGGGRYDYGYSIVCGSDGSIYVNGLYGYQAFFGPFTLYVDGDFYTNEMFVVKMNTEGGFQWAKSVSLACFDNNLMCIDSKDNLYMTNSYSHDKFIGPSLLQWYGYDDVYVLKMDTEGEIVWAKGAGSMNEDRGLGITLLPGDDLAITGYLSTNAAFDSITPSNNSRALFIARLDQIGPMVISEINYKSSDSLNTGDWVELRNNGNESVDITGWTLKDGNDNNQFNIDQATVLNPGDFIVLCQDIDKFSQINPGVLNKVGSFGFELAPNGEKIRLFDENELLISQVYYKSVAPWPVIDDTTGRTMEILDSSGELSDGTNWFAGCPGGSPGRDYFDCATAGLNDPYATLLPIIIYPNPTSAKVNVSIYSNRVSKGKVTIFNIHGKKVVEELIQIDDKGRQSICLSVEHLSTGVYFISLQISNDNYAGKFAVIE